MLVGKTKGRPRLISRQAIVNDDYVILVKAWRWVGHRVAVSVVGIGMYVRYTTHKFGGRLYVYPQPGA